MSSVLVWRLCSAKYAAAAFSGEGARLYGGRWSAPGYRIAYCAESRALAMVEVLVNADEQDRLFSLSWVLVSAEIPDALVEKPARFPEDWRQYPHPSSTQLIGSQWAKEQRSLALRVPSAVVPGEFNYLLNPDHPDFTKVKRGKTQPFSFDPRLQ